MKGSTCGMCIAFEQQGHQPEIGSCKMNPPTIQLVMIPGRPSPSNPNGQAQLTAQGFFPPVRADVDWCMKFKIKTA